MYVLFDTPTVISIAEIDDESQQGAFFSSLVEIVPAEAIIGVGCYAPDPQARAWFNTLPLLEVPDDFNFRGEFEIYRDDYPTGGAFYLRATVENLEHLTQLAKKVALPGELSNHVIGFVHQKPLFTFHDWDEMLITPDVNPARLNAFCRRLGVKYKRIANPQLPSS